MAGDPTYANTVLLIHGDSGTTSVRDSSYNPKTLINVGATSSSTSQSVFGGASLFFNGTTQYLTAADSPDWNLGAGDFTVEAWVYASSFGAERVICGQWVAGSLGWVVSLNSTGNLAFYYTTNGTTVVSTEITTGFTVATNTWTHVAVTRSADSLSLYLAGTRRYVNSAFTATIFNSVGLLGVGGQGDGSGTKFSGYMDEIHVKKGAARYTGITLTVPSGPAQEYPAVQAGDPYFGSVALLVHGDGGATDIVDVSNTQKTLSVIGNTVSTTAQSVFGGRSIFFDGTGDVISIPYHTDWNFGSGNFTVEARVYTQQAAGVSRGVLGQWITGNYGWFVYLDASNRLGFLYSVDGSTIITTEFIPTALSINTWYSFAIVRNGTTLSIYLDGVLAYSNIAFSATINASTGIFGIGGRGDATGSPWWGYLDEIRISKGVARYAGSSYTIATTPFSDYSGQFSGNIVESTAITDWRVTASNISDGKILRSGVFTNSEYVINSPYIIPAILILTPKIDYYWEASRSTALTDCVVASNPDSTPHLWKCTTVGVTGFIEPIWNLSGTTTDGTTTWTYIAPLVDPVTIGPKIPV